jgi:hypothetical protein
VYQQARAAGPAEQLPIRVVLHQARVPVDVYWNPGGGIWRRNRVFMRTYALVLNSKTGLDEEKFIEPVVFTTRSKNPRE